MPCSSLRQGMITVMVRSLYIVSEGPDSPSTETDRAGRSFHAY